MTDAIPLFQGEAMLLRWSDSSANGKTITFALHEDDCKDGHHPFRGLGTGKSGQRFALVAVPITDDGEPNPPEAKATQGSVAKVDPPSTVSGGAKRKFSELPLPQQVALRCQDEQFRRWVTSDMGWRMNEGETVEDWVRRECEVLSRADIKPSTKAAERWGLINDQFLADTGQMAEERR